MTATGYTVPDGAPITIQGGMLRVPDRPIVPFVEGDGTGPDIWRASVRVFDAAVQKAFGGSKRLAWFEVLAGEKAKNLTGEWLPNDTLEAVKAYKIAIKGPLTTPVGGGIRSLNVTLRQVLDLYACVRPVRYFAGTPAPSRGATAPPGRPALSRGAPAPPGLPERVGGMDSPPFVKPLSCDVGPGRTACGW